jgi:acyl-CoA thioesterase-1
MKEKGVAVNDLFAAMTPHLAEYQPPADVHFTGRGYDFLGANVAAAFGAGLK